MSEQAGPETRESAGNGAPAASAPPAGARQPGLFRRSGRWCWGAVCKGYKGGRDRVFDESVLPNIKAEVIVGTLVLLGLGAWWVQETIQERKEHAELKLNFRMSRHEKREEA